MSFAKKSRTRTKVYCFCNKCNGALVDLRTKSKHRSINYKEAGPSRLLPDNDEMGDNEIEINYQEADKMDYKAMEYKLSDIPGPLPERNYLFLTKKMPINESENLQLVKDNDDQNRPSKDSGEEDDQNIDLDDSDEKKDDDYEEINFTSPEFDNDETKLPPNLNDDVCTWVMLWILQYQQ
ncbi:hypothetical protein C1646_754081 [Rhizophagus diaphanus]|nr:hypothetical protein C1646_754081 [Rhizophagus diaphanus] [Rhizophagus sp. MUCL 43196]